MAKRNSRALTVVGKRARQSEKVVDILLSTISELQRAERQIWALAKENEAQADKTCAHIDDTIGQINRREPDRPIRRNGSFLPSD